MRGENSSDWNNPNGFRLLSRDSLPSPGSNSLAMHGSDLYREVLYELQNEQEDGDSSLSSDRDDDTDGATRSVKPSAKSRRHSVDVDDLSPLVQCSNRYRRRDDARLADAGDMDDLRLPQPPYNNKPARSILRQWGNPIDNDDSLKARNRCRVTFKDSFDVISSPRGRRASIAESNPSHRKQANADETSVAGRSEGEVDDEDTCSESSGSSASDRRRRHSLPHLTAIPNGVVPGAGEPENPGVSRLSLQDIEQDLDEGVKCEVVHSFTPRPRPRRCSYAGISGLESKYKEDSPVQQTPRPSNGSGTTRPNNGSGTTRPVVPAVNKAQPNKKISPSGNAGGKLTRKNSAGKTSGKKDPPKVQSSKKDAPSSRRHSVV